MDGGRPRPIIEPLLRLATHMMKCPANDRYLFNLIESPREDIPELSQRFTAQASFFRQMPDIPNWLVKEKVDRALDRLSMKLRFIVRDPGQYPDLAGSRGMTTYIFPKSSLSCHEVPSLLSMFFSHTPSKRNPCCIADYEMMRSPDMDHFARISIADDVRLSGVLPVICLNERMFTVFEELKNRPGNNTNQILNAEFNLAKTFLHELAHAIHFATDPDAYRVAYCMSKNHLPILPFKNMEPLFEEEGKLELGYSYENFVFGGLGRWDLGPDEPSFVNDWPCTNGPGVYMRGPEEATKVYVMPMTFIHSVHQQPFVSPSTPQLQLFRSFALFHAQG